MGATVAYIYLGKHHFLIIFKPTPQEEIHTWYYKSDKEPMVKEFLGIGVSL